ncbi:MAG: hypothetical protein RLZZ337_1038 [Bacteroidota bacterium]
MELRIKYYGHSCFMVQTEGKSILFDPFISPNPLAEAIDVSTIIPDFIFISHGHGDHIADAVQIAKQSKAQVIATYEVCEWLKNQGIENFIPMNTGGSIDLSFFKVKLVYASHSSSMPDGTYGGNPVGFVFKTPSHQFYYAGDTALTYEMKLIKEEFKLDFAFLPIGDHFTMGVKDALKAAEFVGCNTVVGMHFDTFPPIQINHKEAVSLFSSAGRKLIIPEINNTLEF